MLWDILICSIPHRTDQLTELLAEFERQLMPRVGVHVYRDNLNIEYGTKCQALLDSSTAEYVSFFDDDDWPAKDFVKTIVRALKKKPDYVGFNVQFTEDGMPQMPVYHSLQYDGWVNNPEALYRDIVHFNPIRRELAIQSRWEGGGGADIHWAAGLRALGCVETEVYIDRELYHYRHEGLNFTIPARMADPPPQPDFDFVEWIQP